MYKVDFSCNPAKKRGLNHVKIHSLRYNSFLFFSILISLLVSQLRTRKKPTIETGCDSPSMNYEVKGKMMTEYSLDRNLDHVDAEEYFVLLILEINLNKFALLQVYSFLKNLAHNCISKTLISRIGYSYALYVITHWWIKVSKNFVCRKIIKSIAGTISGLADGLCTILFRLTSRN